MRKWQWKQSNDIQTYLESESGIWPESESISKNMWQDGNIFRKWEWRKSNDIQIYLESGSGIWQLRDGSAKVCYKMEVYLQSESEKKVMIFQNIEKGRVKNK